MENSADRGDGPARVLRSAVRDGAASTGDGDATGNGHPPAAASPDEAPPDWLHRPWQRVVVKLSGEAFSGEEPLGISPRVVQRIAREIVAVVRDGVQVAAKRPQYVTRDQVPANIVDRERSIAERITRDEGKPEQAIPKIVEGRLGAFFKDVALIEQPFVKDPKKTIKQMLGEQGVTVRAFARFQIGQAG